MVGFAHTHSPAVASNVAPRTVARHAHRVVPRHRHVLRGAADARAVGAGTVATLPVGVGGALAAEAVGGDGGARRGTSRHWRPLGSKNLPVAHATAAAAVPPALQSPVTWARGNTGWAEGKRVRRESREGARRRARRRDGPGRPLFSNDYKNSADNDARDGRPRGRTSSCVTTWASTSATPQSSATTTAERRAVEGLMSSGGGSGVPGKVPPRRMVDGSR